MLINAGVSDNLDLVDRRGFALVHSHLKVDGVVGDIDLYGLDVEEEVPAVGIEFGHRIVVVGETVVEGLEVIDIAGFDTQRSVQQFVRIDGIADPFDGAHVVLIALANGHVDIHAVRILRVRNDTIRHDICIAETMLVILLDNRLFVLLVLLANEFLGPEEVDDIVIVGLLHRLVDLAMGEVLVTGDIDLSDLGFGLLIHSDEDFDVARMVGIVALDNMYFGIVEAFLREVFFYYRLRMILEVGRHLRSLPETGFDFDILAFAFLESFVAHFADTGSLLQLNNQPDLGAFDLLRFDLDGGEESLLPEAFDSLGNLVSRYFNLIADRQAGETDKHEILVTIGALHFDARDLVGLTRHTVFDLRHISGRHRVVLRPQAKTEYQQ